MFETLSEKLNAVFDKLRGRGALSEGEVLDALRAVRIALLEADVALPVVKDFIEKVKERAIGQEVLRSVTPAQMVIKIVHDALVDLFGNETTPLNLSVAPPAVILMVGLQGSGKTTTTAKIARYLKEKHNKKVMMASLDIYRPAAQEQLTVLGTQHHLNVLPIVKGEAPRAITERALKTAQLDACDVLLLDTAGRLHLDDAMMEEIVTIHKHAVPVETLLVADAMTGQDAVNIAKGFGEKVPLTGIILTRMDGDARGGAALSMVGVAKCPIKFVGLGEKIDKLEVFHPKRMADRILGMGDIVSLVEKAAEAVDQEEMAALTQKMEKGLFDLNDMAIQLKQMQKMGGVGTLLNMLPGVGKIKDKLTESGFGDKAIIHQIAIIQSMTPRERRYPKLLNASRKKRVALGAGVNVQEINKLLKQFESMGKMMKRVKKLGKTGMMRGGLQGLLGR